MCTYPLIADSKKKKPRLDRCRVELHYGTILGDEFGPSSLRNFATANEISDSVSSAFDTTFVYELVWSNSTYKLHFKVHYSLNRHGSDE